MTERSDEREATATPDSHPRRWLERVKINQFRSVEPGTELRFSDGLHVVLGKNASGKSTLLDLIAASLDLNFDRPALQGEPLDLEIVLRAGEFRVEARVKRLVREGRDRGMLGGGDANRSPYQEGHYVFCGPSGFKATVVLTSDDLPKRTVEGVEPKPYGLDEALGWRHQRPPLAPLLRMLRNLWFQGSLYKAPALGSLLGEGAFSIGDDDQVPIRMPESDELLKALEGDDFEICLGKGMKSYPGWLPIKMHDLLPDDGAPIDVPLAHEPILSAFVHEMGFAEARMYLGPPRVEPRHGMETFVYSSPTFTFYRDGRLARRGDQLSYGQRRLFALGWYLVCNRDVAILDEPANGLHESWVEFLVSQLHQRQVFLTSQNREVLDMLPFHTETELRRGFVLCESRPRTGDDEPSLHWRGLREDEAALMIKALRSSRVDLITDLLRVLNLW
jgi:energy-coupling factor transporter ATP-binding protein EcfA2